MVPGCIEKVHQRTDDAYGLCRWTADELYPEYRYRLDTVPVDIRDWMDHRTLLVDAWKTSYNGFRQEFTRLHICERDLYDSYSL
jgi:hypothetical protein